MTLVLCLLVLISNCCLPVYAGETETFYARIIQDDCNLYISPVDVDDYTNVLFVLPKTYFVQLIDNAGNDFFKVKYKSFFGYVKKDKVQTVVGTPQTPYLDDLNFRVFADLSRDMRSCPSTKNGSANQIVYIPSLSRNLVYYGTISGESLIDGRTDVWYYCKYTAEQDYYGYIYSDFCDELQTPLPSNTETLEYTTAPNFNISQSEQTALPLENKTTGIIIAILSIPACLFVYLLFKSSKIITSKRTNKKEVIDY